MISRLYIFIIFIIIFLRIFFCRIWYHLIVLLIILEIFILRIFLLLNLFLLSFKRSFFFIFCFITLRVAEARIGLSILTILIRSHGNDYIKIIVY